MPAPAAHLLGLSAEDRSWLESRLREFAQSWDEERLASAVGRLPPDGPLRRPALIEMVKIDMERRWGSGRPIDLEAYRDTVPELGASETVPAELILAEYELRRRFGAPEEPSVFVKRFPSRSEEVRRLLAQAEQTLSRVEPPPGSDHGTLTPLASAGTSIGRPEAGPGPEVKVPEQFGRYRILKTLGRGAMGAVYLAHDSQLDRQVALKVPHFGPEDTELRRRFAREARAASTLDHPNLCPVYDVGEIDGIPYLTMAYVEGQALSEVIRGGKALAPRPAAGLVRKLAVALGEAHRRGVIHRDLKPSNVMINQRNEPVVMDFGLARRIHHEDTRLTRSGELLGTPAYMAPEQVSGDVNTVGPLSDVYSLGVILYELLTGQLPFRGPMAVVFGKILTEEPVAPSALQPGLDPVLDATCLKAMAKRPEDRYATMKDFAADLGRYLKGKGAAVKATPVAARRTAAPPASPAIAAAADNDPWATPVGDKPAARPDVAPDPISRLRQTGRARWPWVAVALALASAASLLAISAAIRRAGPDRSENGAEAREFRADDVVRTLTVRLDVGAGGGDLQERVALDLGLGFPLWLEPLGSQPQEKIPFGAVPQQTTAGTKVPAGSSVTFTFAAQGEAGQDVLRTTPYLLDDVRIADVSRVGFASLGAGDWELAGFEIQVNGRAFVSADKVNVKPKALQEEARSKLAALGLKVGPLERERAELHALIKTGLGTADDTRHLEEVEKRLAELTPEKGRLEAQLQGQFPWYVAQVPKLSGASQDPAPVRSAKVKVLTCTHDGADTRNYVYFRTGGHKYLLGTPDRPLSGAYGLQEFPLDLERGPLTQDGLRGWAVGMLARPEPQGAVPDRWHPRRILVEIDGRVVYDSEENDKDRRSLDAIRVIPPAQVDADGTARTNAPNSRETFLWKAGEGQGLTEEGKPRPLPAPDDPDYPKPEPGLPDTGQDPKGPDGTDPKPPVADNVNDDAPNFPGEGQSGGDSTSWPSGPIIINVTQNFFNGGYDPPPAGNPFQIDNVRITVGVRVSDAFTVRWDTYGNESAIDHYEVSLIRIKPESSLPYGPVFVLSNNVPPGLHSWTAAPGGLAGLAPDPKLYLAPLVVAVPVDTTNGYLHSRIGPAKPVFPATPLLPQPALHPLFWWTNPTTPAPPPVPLMPPASPLNLHYLGTGMQPGVARAAWVAGQVESKGILFDTADPANNVTVRPQVVPGNDDLRVWLRTGLMAPAPAGVDRTLAAYVGFEGTTPGNQVQVRMAFRRVGPGGVPFGPAVFTSTAWQTINAADVVPLVLTIPGGKPLGAPPLYQLIIRFEVKNFAGDPAHPPTLLGVRLVQ